MCFYLAQRRMTSASAGFSSSVIYRGYIDDPSNTDNAWREAEVWNFHYENNDTFNEQNLVNLESILSSWFHKHNALYENKVLEYWSRVSAAWRVSAAYSLNQSRRQFICNLWWHNWSWQMNGTKNFKFWHLGWFNGIFRTDPPEFL